MTIAKIAWSNIIRRPLNSALCVGLLTFGVGIITLLLVMQQQLDRKFARDLRDTDLVVGAKGSPLQLVLSAIYHLDAPPGNIPLGEARTVMDNRMVKQAIPLAYGDSYRGYRILGTTAAYVEKYDGQLTEGRMYAAPMEVTLGARMAATTGLSVGDTFFGTHGQVDGGHVHDEFAYRVVGILDATNTVLDQLILTPIASAWLVHHEPADEHAHDEHDHHEQDVADAAMSLEEAGDDREITAILLTYRTKRSVLSMPRIINAGTSLQAVLPTLEINRLFYALGIGIVALQLIAGGIIVMAGFSVFFVLYSRLRDRRYELALLRAVGYQPGQLFGLLVLEGLLLAALGYILGWLLSRGGLYLINQRAQQDYNLQFSGGWTADEWALLAVTLAVGLLAALLPAWRAMRTDVAAHLR